MLIKRTLGALLMLVLVGVSAWALQPAGNLFDTNSDEVPRITVQELKEKMDKKEKVTVVDVRASATIVIKGALLIPVNEIEKRLAELPKDHLIVTVCS
jgi:hypothetical protein